MAPVTPSVEQRTACDHDTGMACSSVGPGHQLHAMRHRLASATPSKWRDAIVRDVSPAGWIDLVTVADDLPVRAWHHAPLGDSLRDGDPVALHIAYPVLAIGSAWFSVLVVGDRPS